MIKRYHIRLKETQEEIVLPESFDDAEWVSDLEEWVFYRKGKPVIKIEGNIVQVVGMRVESYE